MATKDSASLLLKLSEMLSEKAHELKQMVSSGSGDHNRGASDPGARGKFECEKGPKTWKSGKRRVNNSAKYLLTYKTRLYHHQIYGDVLMPCKEALSSL